MPFSTDHSLMRSALLLLLALAVSACGPDASPDAPEASGETTETATPEAPAGELTVSNARTVAAPEGRTGGAFMTITGGATADTLLAARFAGAQETQVHESYQTDEGLSDMRRIPGVPIPAGETVELRPGGYHIMLMGLTEPLATGDTIDVELEMAQAGTVPVRVAVRPIEEIRGEAAE